MAQTIGQQHGFLLAEGSVATVDQIAELLLAHHAIDQLERQFLGYDFVEQSASHRGQHQLAADANFDGGLQVELAVVKCHAYFFHRRVDTTHRRCAFPLVELPAGKGPFASHPVKTQHDVLRGQNDRPPIGGAQDVVGRHHEHARLHLGFQ